MKAAVAVVTLVVAAAAGCGGGQGDGIFCLCDSPPVADDAPDFCDPIRQTGCLVGQKCTWVIDDLSPMAGHLACATLSGVELPAGAVCERRVGTDDCQAGTACLDHTCKTICDPFATASASGCDALHACDIYPDVFLAQGNQIAGACDARCDPLTQVDAVNATDACGSPDPSAPTHGCETSTFDRFVCTHLPAGVLDLTDRTPARADATPNLLADGCAPGFVPVFVEMTGSTVVTCAGLCAPLEIDNSQPQNADGNAAASAKLPREAAPAAGNATCAPGNKGSEAKQNCVFLWSFVAEANGLPSNSPFNESLGICVGYTHYQFDSNGDTIPDTTFPGCENLPPRSGATPGAFDDAADFGCQTIAHSPGGVGPTFPHLRLGHRASSATPASRRM